MSIGKFALPVFTHESNAALFGDCNYNIIHAWNEMHPHFM